MAQVFISHASADSAVASSVAGWLRQEGHEIFLSGDPEFGMAVGDVWRQRLFDKLFHADALLAVVTQAFRKSEWCAAEIGAALVTGLRILPLLAGPAVSSPLLSSAITQQAVLEDDETTARARLLEALRRMDGAGVATSAEQVVYPGLAAFTAGQVRMFFGRTTESRRLAGRLRTPTDSAGGGLLPVAGPSGCGKSSLVRAGLAPLLEADPDWLVLAPLVPAASPNTDPGVELVWLLTSAGRARGLLWTASEVADTIGRPGGITRLVADLLAAGSARYLLIIVDQAEELLTRTADTECRRFVTVLLEATGGPVRAVATIRSDYLDPLRGLAKDIGLPIGDPFRVTPLEPEMLQQVITRPARRAGITVDEDLCRRLVADTGSGDALPLLAFVLAELAVRHEVA